MVITPRVTEKYERSLLFTPLPATITMLQCHLLDCHRKEALDLLCKVVMAPILDAVCQRLRCLFWLSERLGQYKKIYMSPTRRR